MASPSVTLLFACLLALAAPQIEPTPSLQPTPAQSVRKEQQPADKHTAAEPFINKQQTETNQWSTEKENSESNKPWLLKFADRYGNAINALSTFIMAVFTIALFFTTYLLWKSGEKHSERALRAYISYPKIEVRHFGNDIEPLEVILSVKKLRANPSV